MEAMQGGCWGVLSWDTLVPQGTREHGRFCKKAYYGAGMKGGFAGSSQGAGPVEGGSEGKLWLVSGVEGPWLALGKKSRRGGPVEECLAVTRLAFKHRSA